MTAITETSRLNDLLKWEEENFYSRDKVTVAMGQNLVMGVVAGMITNTKKVTALKLGPTTGAGTVAVTASGTTVTGTGTTFLTTFAVGDKITANSETHTISAITSDTAMTTDAWTGAASGVSYTYLDGAQNAFGIILHPTDATLADTEGVCLVREGIVADSMLVWPAGITAAQKAAAIAQLRSPLGIIIKEEA